MNSEIKLEAVLVRKNEVVLDRQVLGIVRVYDGELATLEDWEKSNEHPYLRPVRLTYQNLAPPRSKGEDVTVPQHVLG